jgi:uncharacterized protein (DUF1697 family)
VTAAAPAVAAPRCVALLRGINVGRAQRLPMADLKALLEELGCRAVRTALNSGNAVFDAPCAAQAVGLAGQLHGNLLQRLGLTVPVQVRHAALWRSIVAANPLVEHADDASRLLVIFPAHGQAIADHAPARASLAPAERLHVGPDAAYLWCADGILQSRAGAALLGPAGRHVTTRNWATVLKIDALL